MNDPIWDKIDMSGGLDACWPWMGARAPTGYGRFGRKDIPFQVASRYVYRLAHPHEPMPEVVMHECDNPPCCNPLHLSGGDQLTNMRQASERGRLARGERNGAAKLTDAQVAEIREARAAGEKLRVIAERYGVSHNHVSRIANNTRRAA